MRAKSVASMFLESICRIQMYQCLWEWRRKFQKLLHVFSRSVQCEMGLTGLHNSCGSLLVEVLMVEWCRQTVQIFRGHWSIGLLVFCCLHVTWQSFRDVFKIMFLHFAWALFYWKYVLNSLSTGLQRKKFDIFCELVHVYSTNLLCCPAGWFFNTVKYSKMLSITISRISYLFVDFLQWLP